MKQHKKYLPGLVLLLCLLVSFGLTTVVGSQSAGTQVFVEPALVEATTCGEETIAIRVENVADLTGYYLEIGFDPAVIEVTGVENGGFLDGDVDPDFYAPTNAVDNVNGLIRFGMVQQNSIAQPITPKTGTGDLIHITFRSLAPNGTTAITIDADNSMLVDWPDAFEVDFTAVNGFVDTVSCSPTDLELSKLTVPENEPAGTEVGLFATTDPDPSDSFTYTFVNSSAYPDNGSFEIVGNRLLTRDPFNFEEKSSYEVKVRSTDSGGQWFEKLIEITIGDVNDRPLAYGQTLITTQEQAVAIKLTGFDEDGDPLTFAVTESPKFGSLSGASPNLIYTPDEGYVGPDSFKFTAADAELTSEAATVSIEMESKWTEKYLFPIFFSD